MAKKIYLPEYNCNENLRNRSDDEIIEFIESIIDEALIINRIYYDLDDIRCAVEELLPIISDVMLNPRNTHLKGDVKEFVEVVTFLSVKM